MSDEKRDFWKFQKELNTFLKNTQEPPVTDKDPDGGGEEVSNDEPQKAPRFDMKPEELISYLDQYVVKQSSAKEIIATKVCTHFNRIRLGDEFDQAQIDIKNNIIMIGPTGVGKTFIIRLIARKIGVPFVKADATKFSETGYVGGDVEDLIRELVQKAGGDIKLAESGIIYVDEIDKIASAGSSVGPDVSRSGVQRNLLKLMEETEVDLKAPHDLVSQMESVMQLQRNGKVEKKRISTRNILFIVSGAFFGLEEIIAKRLKRRDIGFTSAKVENELTECEIFSMARAEDLISYGFESEFVGRLPVLAVLGELDVDDLYGILANSNNSVLQAKKLDFKAYGIDLTFEDEALKKLAQLAYQEKTGARGLLSVIEKTLMKYERKLPSRGVRKLVVTGKMVDDPEGMIDDVIFEGSLESFVADFHDQTGVWLDFTEDGRAELRRLSGEKERGADWLCREFFKDYSLGLKLIDIDTFRVTREVLDDPKRFLDKMIKEHYGDRVEEGGKSVEE